MPIHGFAIRGLIVSMVAVSTGFAQQEVVPPPRPTDDGPSLEVTMKLVADKLAENASAKWKLTVSSPDGWGFTWVTSQLAEVKSVRGSCELDYRMTQSQDPPQRVNSDTTYAIAYKLVKSLSVTSLQDYSNEEAATNQPGMSLGVSPPVYALVVTFSQGPVQVIPFDDEEIAHRLAKAIVHAVELCGGGE